MKATDSAIFLHRIPYSESSLIITFYTAKEGIQKFIFQGGKKKASALFPLSVCEITYYKRQDSELGKLTNATAEFALLDIISNPIKSAIAFFMVDLLRQTLQTNEQEISIFSFLKSEIQRLNKTQSVKYFPIEFLARFTNPLGFAPLITIDPICFDILEGEFTKHIETGNVTVSGDNCQGLYQAFTGQEISKGNPKEILDHLLHYYKSHSAGFNVENSLSIVQEVLHS